MYSVRPPRRATPSFRANVSTFAIGYAAERTNGQEHCCADAERAREGEGGVAARCSLLSAIDSLRSLYLRTPLTPYSGREALMYSSYRMGQGRREWLCITYFNLRQVQTQCDHLRIYMPNYHREGGGDKNSDRPDLLHSITYRTAGRSIISLPAAHRTAACHRRCTATVTSREIPPTPVSFQARAAAAAERPTRRSFRGRRSSTPRSR